MDVFRDAATPLRPADPRTFSGPVQSKRLASGDAPTRVHVYRVEFESGGRTHWHSHSGVQWLFVVEGRVRVRTRGGPVQDLSAGDAVAIAPGETHWHGAVPGHRGAHLAINIDLETTWLEAVSDPEYRDGPEGG